MSTETSTTTRVKIQPKTNLTPPPNFQVIFVNDNVTTVQFVMAVLQDLFGHDEDHAMNLTAKIHEQGQTTVAVLPFEIAESKAVEVTVLARQNKFPLTVKLEPEV